jgi:nicotinate-nucleotide pyrophosphorylase (carboxylating)
MVLIKENHIACAGGIGRAVAGARSANRAGLKIEVETTNLEVVNEALAAGVDRIMLDNMSPSMVRDAVAIVRGRTPRPEVEASGGVTLETVRELAEAGVDFISVGALTHSAPALDLSLRLSRVEP